MWEINLKSQILSFLGSIVLGFIFCVIYDLLRVVRKYGKINDLRVFIEDIIYFAVISIITFIYYLPLTNGEIRFYILCGIFIGFLTLRLTLSYYILIVLNFIIKALIKVQNLFLNGFYWFFVKIDNIFVIMYKKTIKIFKKCLKTSRKMLYNNKS
jgi:spore cortex biosynthesis protein YabQ